jgi:hypothetical protein
MGSGTTGDWLTAQPGEVWIQSMDNLPGGSPLPLETMQLQGIFQSVFMPPFRIGDYMGDMPSAGGTSSVRSTSLPCRGMGWPG